MKVRHNNRIVSVAVIVAIGVNTDSRREVLGMTIGPSEAETFWIVFLRNLARRGLRGVKLVTSDAHEGIKAAVGKVMNATWQRCRAVPVGDRIRCLALALYGPHATGNDLNHDERAMLAELAEKAACAFIKLDRDQLRHRIAELEYELEVIATQLAAAGSSSSRQSTEAKS